MQTNKRTSQATAHIIFIAFCELGFFFAGLHFARSAAVSELQSEAIRLPLEPPRQGVHGQLEQRLERREDHLEEHECHERRWFRAARRGAVVDRCGEAERLDERPRAEERREGAQDEEKVDLGD